MTAPETYAWLMGPREDFAVHVLASILAVAMAETAANGQTLAEAAGFGPSPELTALFPQAARELSPEEPPLRPEDEACLLELLTRGTTAGSAFERLLAGMIARRSQRPNHLWQDLGLANRNELSRLMTEWFAPLARRNTQDMKWKKFFARMICRDAAYTLCTAPSCNACNDFDACFGDESGESLLAHMRHNTETCTKPDVSGLRQSQPLEPIGQGRGTDIAG
jgi:nitrogen fixation protein NifQ